MDFNAPLFNPFNFFRMNSLEKTYKSLDEALTLIREVVERENTYQMFYDYLISAALTMEEKDIITSIRDNNIKHNKFFREIYGFYTGQLIPISTVLTFMKPESYEAGITKAKFRELESVEENRIIRAGIPSNYYKDMIFEILTDRLNHSHKYDHILYLNLKRKLLNNDLNLEAQAIEKEPATYCSTPRGYYRKTRVFTLEELANYDGSSGKPAYIAINGIVYDVSNKAACGDGTHFGLTAGRDLTSQFQGCHKVTSVLGKLPSVGVLKV